jgi:hypothetical protein
VAIVVPLLEVSNVALHDENGIPEIRDENLLLAKA